MAEDKKDVEMMHVVGMMGKGRIALWERHDDHPVPPGENRGEVTVTDEPAYIAVTPRAKVALRHKEIVEISKEEYEDFWRKRNEELAQLKPEYNSDVDVVADPLASVPEIVAERKAYEDAANALNPVAQPEQKQEENGEGGKGEQKPAGEQPVAQTGTKKSGAK